MQAVPLCVQAVGGRLSPVRLARQPMPTLPFGAVVTLYEACTAVTAPVPGVRVAPQPLVLVCPAGRARTVADPRSPWYRCGDRHRGREAGAPGAGRGRHPAGDGRGPGAGPVP
ncbi:hypothetical protein GCM10020295_09750 [Streptomyces cinereospinus]